MYEPINLLEFETSEPLKIIGMKIRAFSYEGHKYFVSDVA